MRKNRTQRIVGALCARCGHPKPAPFRRPRKYGSGWVFPPCRWCPS